MLFYVSEVQWFLCFLCQGAYICDDYDRFSVKLSPRNPKIVYLLHLSSTEVCEAVYVCLLLLLKSTFSSVCRHSAAHCSQRTTLQDCWSPGVIGIPYNSILCMYVIAVLGLQSKQEGAEHQAWSARMFNTRVKNLSLPNQTARGQFVRRSKPSVSVFPISFIWKFVCNAEKLKPTNSILTQVLLWSVWRHFHCPPLWICWLWK